jgi:hypothetical protein
MMSLLPLGGDLVEGPAIAVEHRGLAREVLPALHPDVDIGGAKLDSVASAAGHRGRDYRCSTTTERLIDRLPRRGIVFDRPAHALDRLLRRVAGFRLLLLIDLPYRGLRPIAGPVRRLAFAHRIPTRLVLVVIVAAPDHHLGLRPDQVAADHESGGQ